MFSVHIGRIDSDFINNKAPNFVTPLGIFELMAGTEASLKIYTEDLEEDDYEVDVVLGGAFFFASYTVDEDHTTEFSFDGTQNISERPYPIRLVLKDVYGGSSSSMLVVSLSHAEDDE